MNWKKVVLFFIFNLAQGFFSYANSGLENSLLFFLETLYLYLILSVNTYDFKRLTLIALVCSLLLMTRLDVAMLIFIPTAYIFLTKRKEKQDNGRKQENQNRYCRYRQPRR